MIPLHDFKELLGEYASQLSNDQLEQLKTKLYQMAAIGFKVWEKKKAVTGRIQQTAKGD